MVKSKVLILLGIFLLFAVDALAARLVDNGDGTVTDNTTGLIWQQAEGGHKTWEAALSYCEALSLGGNADWRLPNIKKLESLTEDSMLNPVIDKDYFPNAYSSSYSDYYAAYYWSSTTYARTTMYAWLVPFNQGGISYGVKSSGFAVRCVRGG